MNRVSYCDTSNMYNTDQYWFKIRFNNYFSKQNLHLTFDSGCKLVKKCSVNFKLKWSSNTAVSEILTLIF